MRKLILLLALMAPGILYAQNALKVILRSNETKQPLAGATAFITSLNKSAPADTSGLVIIRNIPSGKYEVKFSCVGYLPQVKTLTLPSNLQDKPMEVYLEPMAGELAEVVVQTTRTNQNRSAILLSRQAK